MLDHLVYGAPDLDDATRELGHRLGIEPGYGGKHAGGLTHNALLSLGGKSYLEVIAPVPGIDAKADLPFGLGDLRVARLVTWAAAVDDLEKRVEGARAVGYDPGEIITGGRDLPDGRSLSWRLAFRTQVVGDGLVPFLIQWTTDPHPSVTAPMGCRLVALRAEHPEPDSVLTMLNALAIDLDVSQGRQPRLIAIIETPNGRVELS